MRTDIFEYLQKEVYSRCEKPTNKFGMGCYYHIKAVVKNDELLAERYGEEKICLVQKCIRNHRGSIPLERYSVEELCVADADAISHFDSISSLLYLAYVER